jgi:tetratricopeptide (TPR) repeat protein
MKQVLQFVAIALLVVAGSSPLYAQGNPLVGAICMRAMGRPDEAIASMKHARDLDPLSVVFNTSLGWEFYYAHHYAEAIEQFQTSIAMDPTFLLAQLAPIN